MADYKLYTLPVNEAGQFDTGTDTRRQLALQGALEEDLSSVSSLGSEPGEQTVAFNIRSGTVAPMIAKELEELSNAAGVDTVPVYAPNGESDVDGYYAVESADVSRAAPQQDEVWVANTTLRREGRRGSHYRSTSTTQAQVDNPFYDGSDQTMPVGVPTAASKLQWTDDQGARAPVAAADEIATRSGEFGDVQVLDAREAPYDDPTLVYELEFAEEMMTNPVLWDTRGNASKLDGDSNRQWQHVFSTEHDAEGGLVFENGLLRLTLNDEGATPGAQITAETWDGSSWNAVSLGSPSGWEVFDVDVTRAADDRLEAQVTFSDGSQFFEVDVQLPLGGDSVLFSLPDGGPLPGGLDTWLSPIAAEHVYDAQVELGVVAKREVRQ